MAGSQDRTNERTRIGWLHVSDLHVTRDAVHRKGLRRPGLELWAQVRRDFLADIDAQIDTVGLVPDLVLVTGDLAYSGRAEQYRDFDREFLDPLLAALARRGGDPVVLAVPGNHDVRRPEADDLDALKYECLRAYDARDDESPALARMRSRLWSGRDASLVAPLFADYQAWADARVIPTLRPRTSSTGLVIEGLHRSHMPGDLSVVVSRGDLRLLLVGLNSAWIQFDGGDFTHKLQVPYTQLSAALAPDEHAALARFDDVSASLLLMHHPPNEQWLSKRALEAFEGHVYPEDPRSFSACLFGHMHETRVRSVSGQGDGGTHRYFYQSPSLFGLEHYGGTHERIDVGYTLGTVDQDGEIRLWVRRFTPLSTGALAFDVDTGLGREPDGSRLLRRGRPRPPTSARTSAGPGPGPRGTEAVPSDHLALRNWLLPRYQRLELLSPNGTFEYPLDQVYVPLQISMNAEWDVDTPAGADLRRGHGHDLELDAIFERAKDTREVVVFGDPGSGKSTTLTKITHDMLTHGGGAVVGLPPQVQPLLLYLRYLRPEDLAQDDPLLALALREATRIRPAIDTAVIERLWARDLLLLLDGLDEIADPVLRDRLIRHVLAAAEERRARGVRCIISSRRSGVTDSLRKELDSRFLRLDVQPLQLDRIEAMVRSWFRAERCHIRAFHTAEERANAEAEAKDRADDLLAELRRIESEDLEFRTLVATPLLLTLLCAVSGVAGELPRKRPDFYKRCLEVLLRRYRAKTGTSGPVAEDDTIVLLRRVAHRMHEEGRRDKLSVAFFAEWAAGGGTRVGATTEIVKWLHEHAGVLTKFGDDDYGFAHLTFQEYLAAIDIAFEGGDEVRRLAERFGISWWEEVTLLCLAQRQNKVFDAFMGHVLEGERWIDEVPIVDPSAPEVQRPPRSPWQLVSECWRVSAERSVTPFVRVLERKAAPRGWKRWLGGWGRPAAELVDRQRAKVLQLLLDEGDSRVVQSARTLCYDANEEVRVLARELVDRATRNARAPVPAGARTSDEQTVASKATPRPAGGEDAAWIEPTTGMRFLKVPGGAFVMGSAPGEGHSDEQPAHRVELSTFMLAETPVTNAQYAAYVKASAGRVKEPRPWRDRRFSEGEQPVVGVSWYDAQGFCEWLSATCGRKVWLPSEAQWEYAARGTDRREYPWGNEPPDESRACFGQSFESGRTAPVCRYPLGKGPFGHLDLAGNVWEWCQDVWDEQAYQRQDVWSRIDPVVSPSEAVQPERALHELADELAAVLPDADRAVLVARRAGFPASHLPPFRTPIVFWSEVLEQAAHGRIPVAALIEEVAKQFPHNERILAYKQRHGQQDSVRRVCRGGAWRSPARILRAASRRHGEADGGSVVFGFRVACAPASR